MDEYLYKNVGHKITDTVNVSLQSQSSLPGWNPYFIKLMVTSIASGLSVEEIVSITVKLAGDADGSGAVNILDKVIVRNQFGQSGCQCP